MRRDHKPYWLKRLRRIASDYYAQHFLYPAFDHLGESARFLAPQSVRIHGRHICAGDYLHCISDRLKPVKLTTWADRTHQGHISIGNYCLIAPGVEITAFENIAIGDNCMLAADVIIHDCDWHGLYNRLRPFRCNAPVSLGNNVWVGMRSIITKGVTIGENSVIGAGSVVTKDIPANSVACGNPAKVIKSLNPNRRMLKRDYLFQAGDRYWQQQGEIDAYFTLDNTTVHFLRTLAAPNNED